MWHKISDKQFLVFLVLLNIILKLCYIQTNEVGGDEPFSIFHAQLPISNIIHILSKGNNPPLYEIFLHYWIQCFGISEIAVRMPSLIFSTASAIFVFKIGIAFFPRYTAICSALFFTLANYNINLAQEARVYAMFGLFTAAAMFFFLKIIMEKYEIKNYWWLLVFDTLLIYCHYFGFFIIIIQILSIISIQEILKKSFKQFLLFYIVLMVLYIPNIPTLWHQFFTSSSNGTWLGPPTGLVSLYDMLWRFSNAPVTTVLSILMLFFAILLFIYKNDYLLISPKYKILLLWFLFPFLFMFGISFWIPMFLDRYLVFVSIAYYLLLGLTISFLQNQFKYGYFFSILLLISFLLTCTPHIQKHRNLTICLKDIQKLKNDQTILAVWPKDFIFTFLYQYDRALFQKYISNNFTDSLQSEMIHKNIYVIDDLSEAHLDSTKNLLILNAAPYLQDSRISPINFLELDNFRAQNFEYNDKLKLQYYENKRQL